MSAYAPTLPGSIAERGSARPDVKRGLTRDEVMTAREVAELLKMPVSTIYQLAPARGAACQPAGGHVAVSAAAAGRAAGRLSGSGLRLRRRARAARRRA